MSKKLKPEIISSFFSDEELLNMKVAINNSEKVKIFLERKYRFYGYIICYVSFFGWTLAWLVLAKYIEYNVWMLMSALLATLFLSVKYCMSKMSLQIMHSFLEIINYFDREELNYFIEQREKESAERKKEAAENIKNLIEISEFLKDAKKEVEEQK